MAILCSLLRLRRPPGVGKVGMKWGCVDRRGRPPWSGSVERVNMRKVLPYWSTMADDLDVWHDQGDCPEGAKIPPGRLLQGAAPPSARRRCTVCMFLDKAT